MGIPQLGTQNTKLFLAGLSRLSFSEGDCTEGPKPSALRRAVRKGTSNVTAIYGSQDRVLPASNCIVQGDCWLRASMLRTPS